MSEDKHLRWERIGLCCWTAFLGAAVAFGSTAIVGTMTRYDLTAQAVWFWTATPVFSIGGFLLVWRVTR